MTTKIIIESAPTAQARMSMVYQSGKLVIGRGDDADWQLDDPDMYLSRRHCIIVMENEKLSVTDASRGGTFIDGSETPLGTGKSIALEDGMRLRMGDFVFRIDMAGAAATPEKPPVARKPSPFDFADTDPVAKEPPTPRPDSLPDPFDPYAKSQARSAQPDTPKPAPKPFGMDDPFALDTPRRAPAAAPSGGSGSSGGYFDTPSRTPAPTPEPPKPEPTPAATKADETDSPFSFEPAKPRAPIEPQTQTSPPPAPKPTPAPASTPTAAPKPMPVSADDQALLHALLEGMGLDPTALQSDDPVAQARNIGVQYRVLVEGVMQLLRARASAKQQVRVAQTLISSANVNPLKFLATTEDALDTLLKAERPGYLPAEDAINSAFRDLADHQVRTWKALQSALRRMIDQFDPESIESEIAETGMLGSLLAGGRNALLWQTYGERYREIARAAEERFLGEVGENFRDAYEGNDEEKRS